MLIKYLNKLTSPVLSRYSFATGATLDRVNYYNILQVESGATEQEIRKAYAELTSGLRPEFDSSQFKKLNEAFVILIDNKTRDAYDSLLSVRKSFYLSPEDEQVPMTKSYLSKRKENKLEELKKKINIDQFGRYKGGLPQKNGEIRGKSRNEIGVMHRPREIQEALDPFPEFHNVTSEKAESFKNFHQDEREARQMKWPWFSFEVDYDYFTFRTFRKKYWPKIQLAIIFFYVLPTLFFFVEGLIKKLETKELIAKAAAKAQASSKSEVVVSAQTEKHD